MFVGRASELSVLREAYREQRSNLVVLYGRRRVGKSTLVRHFGEGVSRFYGFEGREAAGTKVQIDTFAGSLRGHAPGRAAEGVSFNTWESVLGALTDWIVKRADQNTKIVLFFDELQWMAAGRSRLISTIKYFWDNEWKDRNVMLVLCGSIASFMVEKVIHSKALYGRVTRELLLRGLEPDEAGWFFAGKRSAEERLRYLLVLGTIPRYLEAVNTRRSFAQNMDSLFFTASGEFRNEIDKIFYSQFREGVIYRRIVERMQWGVWRLEDIAKALGLKSGGGLRRYIENLKRADILRVWTPFNRAGGAKLGRYALADEYLHFHFSFVAPNQAAIDENRSGSLFDRLAANRLEPWLGFAFERFCLKHARYLSRVMGFEDTVLRASPWFRTGDSAFQIDLAYLRSDRTITVCEIKFLAEAVSTDVIAEMERKTKLLKIPRGYSVEKALISVSPPDQALVRSAYFDHVLTVDQILPDNDAPGRR